MNPIYKGITLGHEMGRSLRLPACRLRKPFSTRTNDAPIYQISYIIYHIACIICQRRLSNRGSAGVGKCGK